MITQNMNNNDTTLQHQEWGNSTFWLLFCVWFTREWATFIL